MSFWKFCLYLLSSLLVYCCQPGDRTFLALDPKHTGIDFSNDLTEIPEFNVFTYQDYYHGGGVAAGDVNNDGLIDLVFTGNLVTNKLYINLGHFKFKEIPLPPAKGWSTSVSMVDINKDGWLDIYIARSAAKETILRKNLLYINDQKLGFKEQSAAFGLNEDGYTAHAMFGDADKNGELELYNFSGQDGFKIYAFNKGKFTLKTQVDSLKAINAIWLDINCDRQLDLYLAADTYGADHLLINDRGVFKDQTALYFKTMSKFSRGLAYADFQNKGSFELYTTDQLPLNLSDLKTTLSTTMMGNEPKMHKTGASLFTKTESGYENMAFAAGLAQTGWAWCPLVLDYDLDGFVDMFLTRGQAHDYFKKDFLKYAFSNDDRVDQDGAFRFPIEKIKNEQPDFEKPLLFKNNGNLEFKQIKTDFEPSISHGSVAVDLDNDGDLDVVSNKVGNKICILENKTHKPNSLKVVLDAPLAQKLGAVVIVKTKEGIQKQFFQPSSGYLSFNDSPLVFGLGHSEALSIHVQWPNGSFSEISHPKSIINIKPGADTASRIISYEMPQGKDFDEKGWDEQIPQKISGFFKNSHKIKRLGNDLFGILTSNDNSSEISIGNQKFKKIIVPFRVLDFDYGDINGDGISDLVFAHDKIGFVDGESLKIKHLTKTGLWQSVKIIDVDQNGYKDVIAGNMGTNHMLNSYPDFYKYKSGEFSDRNEVPIGVFDHILNKKPELKKLFQNADLFANATASDLGFSKEKIKINELKSLVLYGTKKGFRSQYLPMKFQQRALLDIIIENEEIYFKTATWDFLANRFEHYKEMKICKTR